MSLPVGRNETRHSAEAAYALDDAESHRKFYDAWANDYDSGFVQSAGYIYPEEVARRYLALATPADTPIVDIGCGTGLIGEFFRNTDLEIDGYDISPGMLEKARARQIYHDLIEADLTSHADLPVHRYGGVVSCRTFTLGHLGPAELAKALGMARFGALCVIGINARHYEDAGFDHFFDVLRYSSVGGLISREIGPIYDSGDFPATNENLARYAVFRV